MHLLKIHKCIFSVLEGWESAIRMPAWLGSAESPQLGYRLTSCWVLMWQKEDKRALGSPFQECSHSLIKIPLSWPYQLTRPHLLIPSHCGLEFQHVDLRGGSTYIYSIKMVILSFIQQNFIDHLLYAGCCSIVLREAYGPVSYLGIHRYFHEDPDSDQQRAIELVIFF